MVFEESHVVHQWKRDFREDCDQLPVLRTRLPHIPWAFFSATLEAQPMAQLQSDLSIREPVVIRGLFTRPNIFLDVQFFKSDDINTVTAPLLDVPGRGAQRQDAHIRRQNLCLGGGGPNGSRAWPV